MGNSEKKGLNVGINFQLNIGQYLQYRVCVCSSVFARSANKHTVKEIAKFSTQITNFIGMKRFCFNVSLTTNVYCVDILMKWDLLLGVHIKLFVLANWLCTRNYAIYNSCMH